MTPEEEKVLKRLIDLAEKGESISITELSNELKLYAPYYQAEDILKHLRNEGYISNLKFSNGITRETSSFRCKITRLAYNHFHTLEFQLREKEEQIQQSKERKNETKKQLKRDIIIALIGAAASAFFTNIDRIIAWLTKTLF